MQVRDVCRAINSEGGENPNRQRDKGQIFTFVKEVIFLLALVCLSVSNITQKVINGFDEIFRIVWQ